MNSHSLTNIRPSEDNQCPNTPTTQSSAVAQLAPHDIRRVLHTNRSSSQETPSKSSDFERSPLDPTRVVHAPDGALYYKLNLHYWVTKLKYSNEDSLIDRGANGGFAGGDVRILDKDTSQQTVDVHGIEEHTVKNLKLGTVAGLVQSHRGPIVCIMHQYALYGKGVAIHSCPQF